jgi:hypothetical protein
MEEKKKEIDSDAIEEALVKFFSSGYTHLKMYKDGEVGMFLDGNSDIMGSDELLVQVSLRDLLEDFTSDSPMYPEDVKSLRTRNPEGVSFREYLMAVAQEIYDDLEVD